MKKRNLLSGFALAVLMTLGITGVAKAQTYSSCANFNNNIPSAPTGDVIVNNTGACSLTSVNVSTGSFTVPPTGTITTSAPISATGNVSLTGTTVTVKNVTASNGSAFVKATTGNVSIAALTATGNFIQVLAPAGNITVTGAVNGTNLTQIFSAKTTIALKGGVNNSNGDVRIFANSGSSSTTPFLAGSSSTNGVTFIHNNGSSSRAIYISNGAGTGGITYSGSNTLQVNNSSGATGIIVLDGGANGKVTVSGTLSADGANGQPAGAIDIFAPQVIASSATTLSASAPGHQVGNINLVTNQITTTGSLTLNVNGNGPFAAFVDLSLFPVGSYSVTAPTNPSQFITFGPFTPSAKPLTISGAGALTINANGNNNGLKILGYPLQVTSATTTINNKGSGNGAFIQSTDGGSQRNALTLNGTIAVHANTTTSTDAANTIGIDGTSIAALTGNVLLDGAATASTGGPGSNISLTADSGAINLGGTGNNFTLAADGSSTGGTAGNVTVTDGTGTITINSGNAVLASALGGNGDGGFIDIQGGTINNASSGTATINSDGKGTGNAGTIKLIAAAGTLNLGTSAGKLSLSATGTDGTGGGGYIEIANLTTITVSNDISVAAGTDAGGNGTGGTFNIHDFGTFTITTAGTVNLKADGHGTGKAGTITILSQNSNPIGLNNSVLSASGDTASSGAGGSISVTDLGSITVANATLNANGGGTGGDAGSVLLGVYDVNAVAIDLSTAHINAKAGTNGSNGKGGQFTATFALSFDVNSIVKVDAGSNAAVTVQDGMISLNGIPCGQWKAGTGTGNTSWPLSYWDCVNPTDPTLNPLDQAPISVANGTSLQNIKATYGNNSVGLYVFNNQGDYQSFFATTIGQDAAGYTGVFGTPGHIYSSVWENVPAGTLTNDNLSEVTAHELGHAIGIIKGNPANDATYASSYVERDFINLDYTVIGTSDGTSTRRPACSSNASAPFDGVLDDGDNYICNPSTHVLASKYTGMRNSKIAKTASLGGFDWYAGTEGWREIYPQAFAYEAYVGANITPPNYYARTADGLWSNPAPAAGFTCTIGWAAAVVANQTTPPTITGCTAVLGWYETQVRTDLAH